jgi:hypothetical protein
VQGNENLCSKTLCLPRKTVNCPKSLHPLHIPPTMVQTCYWAAAAELGTAFPRPRSGHVTPMDENGGIVLLTDQQNVLRNLVPTSLPPPASQCRGLVEPWSGKSQSPWSISLWKVAHYPGPPSVNKCVRNKSMCIWNTNRFLLC